MTALSAQLRRILRVNRDNRNARERRLVFKERPPLGETPTAPLRPLLLPEPGPLADPFNSSRAIPRWVSGAFRSEWFADDVIRVPAKAGFLARQIPECAANGLRALALRFALRRRRRQSPALFVVLLADALQLRAARLVAVRIGSAVLDAEVDADEIGRGPRRSLGQIHGHEQKPLAVLAPEEIALAGLSGESLGLVLADDDRNEDPAFERQQGDSINPLERHQPLVIRDARVLPESRAVGFVPAVGFAGLGDAADGHLSRQSEVFAQLAVVELLKFDLVGRLVAESFAGEPIGGGVEGPHGGGKLLGLIAIRQKLCLQSQFHKEQL